MTDPRVMRLLEEILESGRAPEEACADSRNCCGRFARA
jgi:hypothetical protein